MIMLTVREAGLFPGWIKQSGAYLNVEHTKYGIQS